MAASSQDRNRSTSPRALTIIEGVTESLAKIAIPRSASSFVYVRKSISESEIKREIERQAGPRRP